MTEVAYRLAVEVRERTAGSALRVVQAAEREGCEAAWYTSQPSQPDPLGLAEVAARSTQRVQLVPGVFSPRTYSPGCLQQRLRELEASAPGRVQVAIGRGESRHAAAAGPPLPFAEFLMALRAALPVGVGLAVAAVGPATLRLAGGLADTVVLNLGAAPEYVRWAAGEVAQGARGAGRRPPSLACWFRVRDDDARARRDLAFVLTATGQGEFLIGAAGLDPAPLLAMRAAYAADGLKGAVAHLPELWLDRLALPGEPARRQARLEEYRSAGMEIAILPLHAVIA